MRQVEQLETRRLLASFTASSVAELVGDINAANAAGGSNTITLAAGTTFKLSSAELPILAGDELTILGNGDTIERSTAASTPAFRLFGVAAGASLTLKNLTLSGGLAWGGAIASGGTLSLSGVTVQNCTAQGQPGTTAVGGGIYSSGVLTIENSSIRNNQALGGDGIRPSLYEDSWGAPGLGGGVYVAGGSASLTNTTLSSNLARGGNGVDGAVTHGKEGPPLVPGGVGGDGLGGAIYVASGTVQLRGTTITQNTAKGGTGDNSPKGFHRAPDGAGRGGGIYIAAPALVGLDSFTQAHTSGNTASTSDNDIFGSVTILA